MIHRLLFSAKNIVAKSSIALLLAILMASMFAVPAFATDGVLTTSGHVDGYYYECTYTPIHHASHHHGKGHYDVDGYHVECKYTEIKKHDDGYVHSSSHGKGHDRGHGKSYGHGHGHGHSHGHHHCKYTVKQGDNLSTIAAYYGVSFTKLAYKNGLSYPYYLYVGNVLRVPCSHY